MQRPQDTAYLSQFMVPGQTNFAPKIGIWACFSGQGVAGLRIFDGDMDTRLYTDTMDQFMKPGLFASGLMVLGFTCTTTPGIMALVDLTHGFTTKASI